MFRIENERRLMEAAVRDGMMGRYVGDLVEGIRQKHIRPYKMSGGHIVPGPDYDGFRSHKLFESLVFDRSSREICGKDIAEAMKDRRTGREMHLYEAGDAVTTAAFSEINGQIVYSAIMDALESPESTFIGKSLVTTEQASTQHAEIIPGIGQIGDVAESVGEAEEYPTIGLTDEYITIPEKIKDGFIIPITEEAAWEDKTGLLLQRANTGAQAMGITLEKEILDVVLGISTTYSRNGGPKQATYANSHTQGDFDNLVASNALVDWTDIETGELAFDAITDPITGEPVLITGLDIIVPSALRRTVQRIISATEVQHVDNQANASTYRTSGANPLTGTAFNAYSNQFVKQRTSSDSTWFMGDMKGAFGYAEIWPIQTFQMDRNSEAGFGRDIITQLKTRRKGTPFVREPRKAIKCTA